MRARMKRHQDAMRETHQSIHSTRGAPPLVSASPFIRRKMSHEFDRTEIERFSNCLVSESFLVSLRAQDGKEYLSTPLRLISLRALAKTTAFPPRDDTRNSNEIKTEKSK
jgi:hypothetical protein